MDSRSRKKDKRSAKEKLSKQHLRCRKEAVENALEVDAAARQIQDMSFTALLFVQHIGYVLALAFANMVLYPDLLPHTVVLLLVTWQGLWLQVPERVGGTLLLQLVCCGLSVCLTTMNTLLWWRLCLAAVAGYALGQGVHITGSLLMLKFGKAGVRPLLLFGLAWWISSRASAWMRLLLAVALSAAVHKAATLVDKLLFARAVLRKARAEAREALAARQESTNNALAFGRCASEVASEVASEGGSEARTSAMHSTTVGSCSSSDCSASDSRSRAGWCEDVPTERGGFRACGAPPESR